VGRGAGPPDSLRVPVPARHPLHAQHPLLQEEVVAAPLLGPRVLDVVLDPLADDAHRAVGLFAVLCVRVDEKQKLFADVAVSSCPQSTVSRVSQDPLHSYAAGDLAVRVPALAGVDEVLDGFLNGGMVWTRKPRIHLQFSNEKLYPLRWPHACTHV